MTEIMQKTKIEFRKKRDFGELFNATFQYIREEYKTLLKATFIVMIPFLVLMAASGYMLDIFGNDSILTTKNARPVHNPGNVIVHGIIQQFDDAYFWITELWDFLCLAMFMAVVYSHMKLYMNSDTSPMVKQVFAEVKKHIGKILLLSLISIFIVGLSSILFLLPGIFLAVALVFVQVIAVMDKGENADGMNPFKRSFKLIKGYWWKTFFSLAILVAIVLVLKSLPILFEVFVFMGTLSDAIIDESELLLQIYIVTMETIRNLPFIAWVFPMVFIVFHYFNLLERKEAATLMKKISSIKEETV
jgi:hypothetical protein